MPSCGFMHMSALQSAFCPSGSSLGRRFGAATKSGTVIAQFHTPIVTIHIPGKRSIQDGALSFYNLVSDGMPQTRPDQTRSGLNPHRPTRFANPDQTETHPLGKDARPRHKTDASLGQGSIKTDSPLWPGRPYLDRGGCNNSNPY